MESENLCNINVVPTVCSSLLLENVCENLFTGILLRGRHNSHDVLKVEEASVTDGMGLV